MNLLLLFYFSRLVLILEPIEAFAYILLLFFLSFLFPLILWNLTMAEYVYLSF